MSLIVIIESPYMGDVIENVRYARRALRDSLLRGESPFASHLLYTQVLDDGEPCMRRIGIEAGHVFYKVARLCAVYADLGLSPGMMAGIERAGYHGVPVQTRYILRGLENERAFSINHPLIDLPFPYVMPSAK